MSHSQPSSLELLLYLNSLGDVVPLTTFVDIRNLLKELEPFEKDWVRYNPHKGANPRWGLSLTSLDGGLSGKPDLYSLKEYNQLNKTSFREDEFKTFTPVYNASMELQRAVPMVTPGTPLGRSHILRMGQGGFFPPHRDNALTSPECFRLFVSLTYDFESYAFVLNDRKYIFEGGVFYLINTTLSHSLTSFKDYNQFMVFNIPLTVENVEHVNLQLSSN